MDISFGQARTEERTHSAQAASRDWLAGASAIALGVTLLGYLVAFGLWLASTGVNIDGDPAAQPAKMAEQLIRGASSPMWMLYLVVAAAAMLAFAASSTLGVRLSSRSASALGYAALLTLAIAFVLTSEVTQKAGSTVLPRHALEVAIPTLFALAIPGLLAAFNVIAAVWTLTVSWNGWRMRTAPTWLCIVGALTGIGMAAGATGAPGVEVLIAPWLICIGIWLLKGSRSQS